MSSWSQIEHGPQVPDLIFRSEGVQVTHINRLVPSLIQRPLIHYSFIIYNFFVMSLRLSCT